MAVQRKVFRIEEHARPRVPGNHALHEPVARASRELQAIVSGAEQATLRVLRAAEEIDQAAGTLASALESGYGHGLACAIRDRVQEILDACNFQDITGQRAASVAATLKQVEAHTARLEAWRKVERFETDALGNDAGDRRFLNGPKLPGDRGHSTQNEIDGMFRRA